MGNVNNNINSQTIKDNSHKTNIFGKRSYNLFEKNFEDKITYSIHSNKTNYKDANKSDFNINENKYISKIIEKPNDLIASYSYIEKLHSKNKLTNKINSNKKITSANLVLDKITPHYIFDKKYDKYLVQNLKLIKSSTLKENDKMFKLNSKSTNDSIINKASNNKDKNINEKSSQFILLNQPENENYIELLKENNLKNSSKNPSLNKNDSTLHESRIDLKTSYSYNKPQISEILIDDVKEQEFIIDGNKLVPIDTYNPSEKYFYLNFDKDLSNKNKLYLIKYKDSSFLYCNIENNHIKGPFYYINKSGISLKGDISVDNNLNYFFLNEREKYKRNDYKKKDYNFNKEVLENELDNNIIEFESKMNKLIKIYNKDEKIVNIESLFKFRNKNYISIHKWKDNSIYCGEMKEYKKEGIGTYKWVDGTQYCGEFIDDKMQGTGILYYSDSKIYQGEILNGVPDGYGEFIWSDKKRYIGNYKCGKKEGFGIYLMPWKKNYLSYFGFWKNGKQDGCGIYIKSKSISYCIFQDGNKIHEFKDKLNIYKYFSKISKNYIKLFSSDYKDFKKIINTILNDSLDI